MTTRRSCLADVDKTPTTNAGLWLDKFIWNLAKDDKESHRALVTQLSEIPVPDVYSRWFERWQQSLREYSAVLREAEVLGTMVVGLGEESVLETSIALHHTYGVPYIPGSALKGVAASYARQYLGDEWQEEAPAYEVMFGSHNAAGCVTFFDAMPFPGSVCVRPDVMTVHHKDYYQKGTVPPADWDSPTPIQFLSATGRYLVALGGQAPWVGAAFEILEKALLELGVGAKTSSGYGRLRLKPATSDGGASDERVQRLVGEIKALRTSAVAGSIFTFYQRLKEMPATPEEKRLIAEAIVSKVREAGREKETRKKDWFKELLESLQ